MSRDGTRVSSPAHRATIPSTPSAAITSRARITHSRAPPRTATSHPSPSFRSPVASVPIQHVAHVALGDAHLGAVRRPENHLRDLPRHPRRARRIDELGEPAASHAFAAAHRRPNRAIALEQQHRESAVARRDFPRGDQPAWPAAHHQHVHATSRLGPRDARPQPAFRHAAHFVVAGRVPDWILGANRGRGTISSAPTGQGATHFRHPVQIESSMNRPSRLIPIAPGGQRGKHSPQASHRLSSTMAISSDSRIRPRTLGL